MNKGSINKDFDADMVPLDAIAKFYENKHMDEVSLELYDKFIKLLSKDGFFFTSKKNNNEVSIDGTTSPSLGSGYLDSEYGSENEGGQAIEGSVNVIEGIESLRTKKQVEIDNSIIKEVNSEDVTDSASKESYDSAEYESTKWMINDKGRKFVTLNE